MSRALRYTDYKIAWIAILPIEVEAALVALDKRHNGQFESAQGDDYTYIGGEIGGHNVVIAKLPAGQTYGKGAAAALASHLKTRFENIWFALLVGIAAGLPNLSTTINDRRRDIRLGDVLVCMPDKSSAGIIQYDLGKDTEMGFEINGRHPEPPAIVRSAIGDIQQSGKPFYAGNHLAILLEGFCMLADEDKFSYPGQDQDQLFEHRINGGSLLPSDEIVQREPRDELERTRVWLGRIGSGDTLSRNALLRDKLRDRYDLIGLEMEAAGVMNIIPAGVIRGVCDYGDSHKTDRWQAYAAAVAAVYAKAILLRIRPKQTLPTVDELSKGSQSLHHHYNIGTRDDKYHLCAGKLGSPLTTTSAFRFALDLTEAPVIEDNLFIDRSTELEEMGEILHSRSIPQKHHRLVLGGIGGIGKTQLAIAYAKQNYYRYESIFWLNAGSEIVLKRSIRRMAQRILSIETFQTLHDDDRLLLHVTRWLLDPENTQWLLIFDNYDEPEAYDIGEYCPYSTHGSAIITTRVPDQVKGQRLSIRPLKDIQQSLDILATRSKRADVQTGKSIGVRLLSPILTRRVDSYARQLAERMQGFPLALATAGAFLGKSTWTFEEFLRKYEREWNITPRRALRLLEYPQRTLYTTWDVSYRRLEEEDGDAARFLRLAAYFDNQQIWFDLFNKGINDHSPSWLATLMHDSSSFNDTMRVLVDYGFVVLQQTTQSYSIHACVHDWTLAKLNSEIDPCYYWYAFACISNSITGVNRDTLAYVQYIQMALHAKRLMLERFKETRRQISWHHVESLSGIASLLRHQAQLEDAAVVLAEQLDVYQQVLGVRHCLTLDTASKLADLYISQDKLTEAESICIQVLAGYYEASGPNSKDTIGMVHNLGILYQAQGRLAEAEQVFTKALSMYEQGPNTDCSKILKTIYCLSDLYIHRKRLAEAEQTLTEALAKYEQVLGPDHISIIEATHRLGNVYATQGRQAEAEQTYNRELARREQAFGPEHPSIFRTICSLGDLYVSQGEISKAEHTYNRALAGFEKLQGAKHASTLDTVNSLGALYATQGKLTEAERMYRRVISARSDDRTDTKYQHAVHGLMITLNKAVHLQSADSTTRQTSLASLIELTKLWPASYEGIQILGKALTHVKEDEDASMAYLYAHTSSDDTKTLFAIIICDSCDQEIAITGARWICRQCEDIDLCKDCMAKYVVEDLSLPACHGHEYFDVAQHLTPLLEKHELWSKMERDNWLVQLREKYCV